MTQVVVHHFGPDPAEVGGMGSVIRVLSEHRIGGDLIEVHPTWAGRSKVSTLLLTASAALTIARMPRDAIVHVHLSERGSFIREGALVCLAGARGVCTVPTIHGADFLRFADRRRSLVSAV